MVVLCIQFSLQLSISLAAKKKLVIAGKPVCATDFVWSCTWPLLVHLPCKCPAAEYCCAPHLAKLYYHATVHIHTCTCTCASTVVILTVPSIAFLPVMSEEHSEPEAPAPSSAIAVSMDELLEAIHTIVQDKVANAIGDIDPQRPLSFNPQEMPVTSTGMCKDTSVCDNT